MNLGHCSLMQESLGTFDYIRLLHEVVVVMAEVYD